MVRLGELKRSVPSPNWQMAEKTDVGMTWVFHQKILLHCWALAEEFLLTPCVSAGVVLW